MEGCCNMRMTGTTTSGSGGGLGQLDVIGNIFSFASGLFGKDPEKTEYDRIRQQAWDSLVQLVDVHEQDKANGTLTRSVVQNLIDTLTQLMAGFKKYTDGMLSKYPNDAGWITPRFHDYYDFMGDVKNGWSQELATLPADWGFDLVDDVVDYFGGGPTNDVVLPNFPNSPTTDKIPTTVNKSGFDTTSMLLIGGVVVGLVLMSRKRG